MLHFIIGDTNNLLAKIFKIWDKENIFKIQSDFGKCMYFYNILEKRMFFFLNKVILLLYDL